MKMTFRWYGEGNDSVTLDQIRQIPGVEGIVWALHDEPVGNVWPMERILEVKKQADKYGLNIDVVESVNVHEDIKLGLPSRDMYIENYKKTIENLPKVGVKVICLYSTGQEQIFSKKWLTAQLLFSMKKQKLK